MALRKKQENTSAALRAARRRLTASVLTTLLSLALVSAAVFEGVSFGWLALPTREAASDGQGLGSAQFGEEMLGHDIYRHNEKKGVRMDETDGAAVTMNTYDKELPNRNDHTPLLLRAVLSGFDTKETVTLEITCASESYARETVTAETQADYSQKLGRELTVDETIDWLSNVVNVRAAYIPGLESRAVAGEWTPHTSVDQSTAYEDADDYIYSYAVDYFRANEGTITPRRFVEYTQESTPVESSVEISDVFMTLSTVGEIGAETPRTNTEDGGSKVYVLKGYLLKSGSSYVYIDDTRKYKTTDDRGEAAKYPWKLEGSGSRYTLQCSGYYLYQNGRNVTAGSSSTTWTVNGSNGNFQFRSGSYYLTCSNGGFSAQRNSGTGFALERYEICTTTTPQPPKVTMKGNKTLTAYVDLQYAQELGDGGDGRCYIYFLIDYDKELIEEYFTANHVGWKVGGKDVQFWDQFNIKVTGTAA